MEFHGWKGEAFLRILLCLFVRHGILYVEGYGLITKIWKTPPPSTNLLYLDSDSSIEHYILAAVCLICANVGKVHDQERLIVFNVLTGMFMELHHRVQRGNPVLMHVIVDPKLEEPYKVIVAGSSRFGVKSLPKTTEVYNSRI